MPSARRAAILATAAALAVCADVHGQIVTPQGQTMMKPFGQEPKSIARPQSRPRTINISTADLDRLQQWLEAVSMHSAGAQDDPLERVQSWSADELRMLWINATALLSLMHEPAWKKVFVTIVSIHEGGKANPLTLTITPEGKSPTIVKYSLTLTQRLKVMACAAGGDTFCPEILATGLMPRDLDHLADLVRASKRAGDDNFVLRRGAMLHADVAIATHEGVGVSSTGTPTASSFPGPDQFEFNMFDGSGIGSHEVGIHWIIARMLLDEVVPRGSKKPAPGRDDGVREWYRATSAWMQNVQRHDTQHMDRARELFPTDPDILFLSGSQREMFSSGRVQGGVQSAELPKGLTIDVGTDDKETKRAEEYYRRAIAARHDFPEAHLRLGRVLLLRGGYAEAAVHLRQARGGLADPTLEYYDVILLGAAATQLARYDEARASYEAAAVMQPTAQAPLIGLAAMERRRGDRDGTLKALQRMFALPTGEPGRSDPWWKYETSQVRNADELVEQLRESFR
jgi:hypothetical protein